MFVVAKKNTSDIGFMTDDTDMGMLCVSFNSYSIGFKVCNS